jgi:hypothetical protein
MGYLLALLVSLGTTLGNEQLTKKTTVTFSESRTPASGSASTSSPGPGIALLTPTFSFDFFFDAAGRDKGGIFFDEFDRSELLCDQPCAIQRLTRSDKHTWSRFVSYHHLLAEVRV